MEQISDLNNLYNIFIDVFKKKANVASIATWRPAKLFSFSAAALGIFFDNKNEALKLQDHLSSLLKSNPLIIEAAYIAKDVYSLEGKGELKGGWHRSNAFPDIQYCTEEGFVSALYSRENISHKEYVYAIAGTNPKSIEDWGNNLAQLYGTSSYYEMALKNAKELSHRINPEDTLFFVGHSLGGGMATNNALHTGLHAIVFNPAALSQETLVDINREDADVFIQSFISFNDVLNWLQDTSQEFDGMKCVIPASLGKRFYLYNKGVYPIKSHSIELIIENLETIAKL